MISEMPDLSKGAAAELTLVVASILVHCPHMLVTVVLRRKGAVAVRARER